MRMEKKEIKKIVNHMSWGVIWYLVISVGLTTICPVGYMIVEGLRMIIAEKASEAELDAFIDTLTLDENIFGLAANIGVIIGVLFLFLYFRKTVGIRQIFESNRKMAGKSFWKILCVFLGIQLVLELGFMMLERGLNIIGFSLMSSMEEASMNEETFFMLLYAAVIAPVSEELVYRGFVMSSIKKYGKVFAIVVSSVLFGVMHGNLPQALFACMVGVVLGYVTMEYSIGWAIILHIINNGVFGELLYFLISGLSEQQQQVVTWSIMAGFFLHGIVYLWMKIKDIKTYVETNSTRKNNWQYAFTSTGMIIFIVTELAIGFSMVEKL